MLVSTTLKVTSFYAVLHDPNDESRGFDYHVNYVEVKTYDDGEVVKSQERQCNSAKAVEIGLDLGAMLAKLNLVSKAQAEMATAELTKVVEELTETKSVVAALTQRKPVEQVLQPTPVSNVRAPAAEEPVVEPASFLSKVTFGLLGRK